MKKGNPGSQQFLAARPGTVKQSSPPLHLNNFNLNAHGFQTGPRSPSVSSCSMVPQRAYVYWQTSMDHFKCPVSRASANAGQPTWPHICGRRLVRLLPFLLVVLLGQSLARRCYFGPLKGCSTCWQRLRRPCFGRHHSKALDGLGPLGPCQ